MQDHYPMGIRGKSVLTESDGCSRAGWRPMTCSTAGGDLRGARRRCAGLPLLPVLARVLVDLLVGIGHSPALDEHRLDRPVGLLDRHLPVQRLSIDLPGRVLACMLAWLGARAGRGRRRRAAAMIPRHTLQQTSGRSPHRRPQHRAVLGRQKASLKSAFPQVREGLWSLPAGSNR